MTNFEMFKSTVNTLAGSQGFYSRLKEQLDSLTEEELEQAEKQINHIEQVFYDMSDVVLWLEG